MSRKLPIFYSALLLTGVNLLLRMAGTAFQVYLSRRIGAAGIGLLQLTMSAGSLAMVAGVAGIRTTAMYLTAAEIGGGKKNNVSRILSGCFLYSILCSTAAASTLWLAAPQLAGHWIGDPRAVPSLRLFAAFLPAVCLCGVLTGYFTAAQRIGTLAAVQTLEQLCSIAITLTALHHWAGQDPGRACLCVVLGSSFGTLLTLAGLIALRILERPVHAPAFPLRDRLLRTALPLAAGDLVRSGISTTENLMVPKRLSLFAEEAAPLAAFGMISGMVFPVMMFPACILFALAELLIPELARCAAGGQHLRIEYLVKKSLRIALLYGAVFCGLVFLLSGTLCNALYHSPEAGTHLRRYALMIPFLYCDAITDAMTKGLGQQKVCVRYNILTSALDVGLLFFLLPRYGMAGYYFSFLFSHLINFGLSLRWLLRITKPQLPLSLPVLTLASAAVSVRIAAFASGPILQAAAFLPLYGSLLYLLRIVTYEDLIWLTGLLKGKTAAPTRAAA